MNSWLVVAKLIGLDIFQLINIYGMLFEDRTEKFLYCPFWESIYLES